MIEQTTSPATQRSRAVLRRYLLSICLVVVFGFGVFVGRSTMKANAATESVSNKTTSSETAQDIDFDPFWDVWEKVQTKFVRRPADQQQMFYGAISGMVASLGDPYSVYFTPEIAKQFQEELDGTFSGIGAEVGMKNAHVIVIAPLPESPAEAAGLRAGDYVAEINGKTTDGLTVEEAVKQIRGPQGTVVDLTIVREGAKQPIKISITRKTIELKSVTHQMLPGDMLMISISSFNDQTLPQFDQAIAVAKEKNVKGIVVDLRNNPGGFFDGAIEVASEWLEPRQVVVAERGKGNGPRKEFFSTGEHRLLGIPTVVLINGGSASASEIVAGALQDQNKAKIIGEKSFGKGSVQEYEELPDGSALKLTIALWYTPNDRSINESGIQPDIVVEPKKQGSEEPEGYVTRRDPMKDAVVLRALQYLNTKK
ncbi:MAG: hypothetical protein QG607_392 [Patescibacteria group bacterium]|jgi:carboxyl-terminal processing protease|nr:hypothetical protein [Patescibacteria group bacterium]